MSFWTEENIQDLLTENNLNWTTEDALAFSEDFALSLIKGSIKKLGYHSSTTKSNWNEFNEHFRLIQQIYNLPDGTEDKIKEMVETLNKKLFYLDDNSMTLIEIVLFENIGWFRLSYRITLKVTRFYVN